MPQLVKKADALIKPTAEEIKATLEELTKKREAGDRADAKRAEIAPAQIGIADKPGSYSYTSLQYPLQLGGSDQRFKHWVSFFININTASPSYSTTNTIGDDRVTSQGAGMVQGGQQLSTLADAVTTAKVGGDSKAAQLTKDIAGMVVNAVGSVFKAKTTRRTTTAIRLYMPSTLSQSFKQDYFTVSVTEAGGLGLMASQLGPSAIDGMLAGDVSKIAERISNISGGSAIKAEIASKLADKVGSSLGFGKGIGDLIMQGSGQAVNPNEETLYKQPQFRHHLFTFDFYPRSEPESQNVRNIIRHFKMHAAPELRGATGTRYFITPSQFEMEFSINEGKPQEECRIGKVGLCVLEDITLDYAPDEFSVYYDDSPTHIRMQLSFKEIEYITRDMIENKGF